MAGVVELPDSDFVQDGGAKPGGVFQVRSGRLHAFQRFVALRPREVKSNANRVAAKLDTFKLVRLDVIAQVVLRL